MKYLMIVLALTTLLSCKKDKDEEQPSPDYVDQVAGTYVGTEEYIDPNGNLVNSGSGRTLTVTRVDKNKLKISGFYSGSTPFFTTSDAGNGNVSVVIDAPHQTVGIGSNKYLSSSKNLQLSFKMTSNYKTTFNGTKQ